MAGLNLKDWEGTATSVALAASKFLGQPKGHYGQLKGHYGNGRGGRS